MDPSVRERLSRCRDLVAGLDPYLQECTTPQSADLGRLAARTAAEPWADGADGVANHPSPLEQEMLSGHVEGQLLKMLVHVTRASNVLEIGMFTGYSALAMAEALESDGRVVACEIDERAARVARECFSTSEAGHKIEVRMGPALQTLQAMATTGELFELIFIDADKTGYRDYLCAVLDLGLLAPKGLICVDNTLMQGQPWVAGTPTANGAAIADFNQFVVADVRVEQVVLPLRDGLTLIRRLDR